MKRYLGIQLSVLILAAVIGVGNVAAAGTIVVATSDGKKGDLIKLDSESLHALAAYRPDQWAPIASLGGLPDGNLCVIAFKDDKPQEGNRATAVVIDAAGFSGFGASGFTTAYTHNAEGDCLGGATGGIVNRFGEILLYAPDGRFGNFDGAVTLDGLDPDLKIVDSALAGHFERFCPDAGSALANGDWVFVLNNDQLPEAKRHLPGRVQIRKRHDIKTRLEPAWTVDGLPKLTASATIGDDLIAVGDAEGKVRELHRTEEGLSVQATSDALGSSGLEAIVSDLVASPRGDWLVAINQTNAAGKSRGIVLGLHPKTLKAKFRLTLPGPVGALAVRGDGKVLIGTQAGELLLYDRTLTRRIDQVDGFDPITHIAVLASPKQRPKAAKAARHAKPLRRHHQWTSALTPRGKPGTPITLSRDGSSEYFIVCGAAPTTQEIKAAMDLDLWLSEMTGAQFQLVKEDPSREGGYVLFGVGHHIPAQVQVRKAISIGRTRLLEAAGLSESERDLGDDGYTIAQRGENLYLLGGRLRGPINAVYVLLEEDLDCRWYIGYEESIPNRPDLAFTPMLRTYKPVLADRRAPSYSAALNETWSLRNRTTSVSVPIRSDWGGYPKPLAGYVHTFNSLIPKSQFEAHPEYFMFADGKRNPHQLCLTNPAVRKIVIKKTLERLENSPDSQIVDVSPNDGGGTCACQNCKAISDAEGSNMGPLLDMVNAVADAVKVNFPNVQITTLAYLDTKMPPKNLRPRDNVLIWLATDDHNWEYLLLYIWETEKFNTALKAWKKLGANLIIWDYPIDYHNYILPLPNMALVAHNMRYYTEHGATGVFLQAQHNRTTGVDRELKRSWVWAKQLWDLDRDTQALIRDFNYGFYGKAAEPMQEYDEMLWSIWEDLHQDVPGLRELHKKHGAGAFPVYLTKEFVASASNIFDRAEHLAGENEVLLHRVQRERLPILFLQNEQGPGSDLDEHRRNIDKFETIARRNDVKSVRSGLRVPDCDAIIAEWRKKVETKR